MITAVHTGVLLPTALLHTSWFATLSTFVAVNTIMFIALAVAKVLPRVHPSSWFRSQNQRSETRSIYPDDPADPRTATAPRRRADRSAATDVTPTR